MKSECRIVTIGVYGFDEAVFFDTLRKANIQLFCDVRNRRGMRGSKYAFANSTYLQKSLTQLGVKYIHLKELSPPPYIRKIQAQSDNELSITKRQRKLLSSQFIHVYKTEILDKFDFDSFFNELPENVKSIAFFCVEKEPAACHRSIIANHLMAQYNINVENLMP